MVDPLAHIFSLPTQPTDRDVGPQEWPKLHSFQLTHSEMHDTACWTSPEIEIEMEIVWNSHIMDELMISNELSLISVPLFWSNKSSAWHVSMEKNGKKYLCLHPGARWHCRGSVDVAQSRPAWRFRGERSVSAAEKTGLDHIPNVEVILDRRHNFHCPGAWLVGKRLEGVQPPDNQKIYCKLFSCNHFHLYVEPKHPRIHWKSRKRPRAFDMATDENAEPGTNDWRPGQLVTLWR